MLRHGARAMVGARGGIRRAPRPATERARSPPPRARKRRAGFATWIVANIVLIGLSARVGLWWSIGMYLTNIAVCAWSFRSWAQADEGRMRTLFVNRRTAW